MLWAAGLFVGEGYAHASKRQLASGNTRFRPNLAVKMLDGRALERFAAAFGLHFSMGLYERDENRAIFNVRATGGEAVAALSALYPHIAGTAKGQQCRQVLLQCGMADLVAQPQPQDFRSKTSPSPPKRGKRRPRAWLLDTTKFDHQELQWATGLFVAEGYATTIKRTNKGRSYRYPMLSLSMLDEQSVARFGAAFFSSYYSIKGDCWSTGICYRVQVSGTAAEAALRAMYPHLSGTDKGDQIQRVFADLNLELRSDGSGDTWPRTNGWVGKRLSDEHREALYVGRDAYWKRWHDGK